jgi:hypothetical protein
MRAHGSAQSLHLNHKGSSKRHFSIVVSKNRRNFMLERISRAIPRTTSNLRRSNLGRYASCPLRTALSQLSLCSFSGPRTSDTRDAQIKQSTNQRCPLCPASLSHIMTCYCDCVVCPPPPMRLQNDLIFVSPQGQFWFFLRDLHHCRLDFCCCVPLYHTHALVGYGLEAFLSPVRPPRLTPNRSIG